MNYFDPGRAVAAGAARCRASPISRAASCSSASTDAAAISTTGTRTTSRRASALSYQVEREDRGARRLQPHLRAVEPGRAGHGRPVRLPHREPVGDVDRRHHAAATCCSNPYPNGFVPSPGSSQGLLTQAGANLQAPLQDTPSPWTIQFNVNVQRELPWATVRRGRLRRHARLRPVDRRRGRPEPEPARSAVHVARIAAQSAGAEPVLRHRQQRRADAADGRAAGSCCGRIRSSPTSSRSTRRARSRATTRCRSPAASACRTG